jgi:hypothetical protein
LIGYAAFDEQRDQNVAFVLDLTERRRVELALRQPESDFAHTNRLSMMRLVVSDLRTLRKDGVFRSLLTRPSLAGKILFQTRRGRKCRRSWHEV